MYLFKSRRIGLFGLSVMLTLKIGHLSSSDPLITIEVIQRYVGQKSSNLFILRLIVVLDSFS